MGDVLSHFL